MLASRGWPRNKFTEIVTTSRVGRVNYHSRNCNARTRPAFEDLRAERTEGRMDFASDAQIVPDRATPRSTCSPVEDGQEISLPK